jgi:hypothetical protein
LQRVALSLFCIVFLPKTGADEIAPEQSIGGGEKLTLRDQQFRDFAAYMTENPNARPGPGSVVSTVNVRLN